MKLLELIHCKLVNWIKLMKGTKEMKNGEAVMENRNCAEFPECFDKEEVDGGITEPEAEIPSADLRRGGEEEPAAVLFGTSSVADARQEDAPAGRQCFSPEPGTLLQASADLKRGGEEEPDAVLSGASSVADAGAVKTQDCPEWFKNRFDVLSAAVAEYGKRNDELAADLRRKDQLLNEVYQDFKRERDGKLLESLLPLLKMNMEWYQHVYDSAAYYRARIPLSGAGRAAYCDLLGEYEKIREVIANGLFNHGIDIIAPEPGTEFDPHTSRAVECVPADDMKKDRTIKDCVKFGFRYSDGGKILSMAEVTVYRFADNQ